MEIKPPGNDLYTAITRAVTTPQPNPQPAAAIPADWKVAQLLNAVITRIADNQLFMQIQSSQGNTAVNTPLPPGLSVKVGDTLQLQLEQLKPVPQFVIVTARKTEQAVPSLLQTTLAKLKADNVPLQPLLNNIAHIANRPALRPSPLPVEINAAVREWFKQLPASFNSKTASQIREHLYNSGLFLPQKIAQHIKPLLQDISPRQLEQALPLVTQRINHALQGDLATQLYRLAEKIRQLPVSSRQTNTPTPSQPTPVSTDLAMIRQQADALQIFSRQLESALTHLQHQQLQNLAEQQNGRMVWLLELPVRDGAEIDLFELKIERDQKRQQNDKADKIWNLTLQFNLQSLGKIKAHVTMQHEQLSVRFYSEQQQTQRLFQQHLDWLRQRLDCNGLHVAQLDSQQDSTL